MRLEILRGIQQAFASWPVVNAAIWEASDRRDAAEALQTDVGLSEVVAQYVLDLPQGRTTRQAREHVAEEADALTKLLQGE